MWETVFSLQVKTAVCVVIVSLLVLSVFPVWSEPYYHKYRVNFWTWAHREIIELFEGEKDI